MNSYRITSRHASADLRHGRLTSHIRAGYSSVRRLRFESLENRFMLAADLIANGISVSDTTVNPGQSVTVNWTASNIGNSATGFFPLGTSQQGVMWSTDTIISTNDTLLEKEFLGWLDDGDTTAEAHTINIPGNATPGSSYWIGVIADYDGDISESNEGNNSGGVPVKVTVNQADLDVLSVTLDETSDVWYLGEGIDAEVTVKNIGNATANNAEVDYFLGTQGDPDSYFIGNGLLGGLIGFNDMSPGETANDWIGSPLPGGGWTIPADVTPGLGYAIWARASTTSIDGDSTNDWASSAEFSILSPVSWRESSVADAALVDTIRAGLTVFARVEGTPGEQFEIEVWEEDGLGDDKIDAFTITVGAEGFGIEQWTAAWQGNDGDDPQNQYYLYYDGPGLFNPQSAPLSVFVGAEPNVVSYTNRLTYDWGSSGPNEGVIDVRLARLVTGLSFPLPKIDPLMRTWVVIHGRNGSFDGDTDRVKILADQLFDARDEDQILTLDWSQGANSLNDADFSQEAWIVSVANWASQVLTAYGFPVENVNLIGHSFGGVIAGELAAALPSGVNTLLAIDPAEDPPIAASGSTYSTDNVVFGADNSSYSWAFYSADGGPISGLAGNEETPTTADEAFVVEQSEHTRVVSLVSAMIAAPYGTVSRYFSLDRLLAYADGPWQRNRYLANGNLDFDDGLYEAVILSMDQGTNPVISVPVLIDFIYNSGFPVPAPGDYDQDNDVDGGDFLRWQRSFGLVGTQLPADGNLTGKIDRGDLQMWAANYGPASPPQINSAIQVTDPLDSSPEATSLASFWLSLELFSIDNEHSFASPLEDMHLDEWLLNPVGQLSEKSEHATLKHAVSAVVATPEHDDQVVEPWLTDELLEQVFG